MRTKRAWALLALIVGACAIPDVSIVDSLDDTGDGGTSNDSGGTKTSAGQTGHSPGDGGANDGDGGDGSSGARPSGGRPSAGSGGSGGSRAGSGGGGRGGSGPLPPGEAVAKFCNEVTLGAADVDMELRIGSVSNPTRIVARTGTCRPIVSDDCAPIPTGVAMPIQVYDLAGNKYWEGSANITAGEAWLFLFYYDAEAAVPELTARADITAQECAEIDFDTLFPSEP